MYLCHIIVIVLSVCSWRLNEQAWPALTRSSVWILSLPTAQPRVHCTYMYNRDQYTIAPHHLTDTTFARQYPIILYIHSCQKLFKISIKYFTIHLLYYLQINVTTNIVQLKIIHFSDTWSCIINKYPSKINNNIIMK